MMDFILVFVTISLVLIDLIVVLLFNECIQLLFQKDRQWFRLFLFWLGILFVQTALYSWLPGRVGAELSLYDGTFVLEDGALIRNLGYIILAHVVGFVLSLLKYIWHVITGKDKIRWKPVLLETAIICAIAVIASQLIRSEYVIHFAGGEALGKAVMIILAVIGGSAVVMGFRQARMEKRAAKKEPGTAAGAKKAAVKQDMAPEVRARFDQIMAEKNRLAAQGDHASQIPLLIEAVGLDVDDTSKARIWNYLGAAYKQIDGEEKAAECFRNGINIDPGHPSSYINLAFYLSDKKEYNTAIRYADKAIAKAKKRRFDLGQFYAASALFAGQSGDRQKSDKYLQLAKDTGCSPEYLASIQSRLGK